MPSAAEQAKRNTRIRERRAFGASIDELAREFTLSKTRIKQILRNGESLPPHRSRDDQRVLAEVRREQLIQIYEEIQQLAQDMPIEQASAKIGAYKATIDALGRVMAYEEALGFLPIGHVYGQMTTGY